MTRNILLPTDFSDNAWSAIVYALKLFVDKKCTFYFLNSYKLESSRMSSLSNKLAEVMKENAYKDLKELKRLARIYDANSIHEFKTLLSTDSIQKAIEGAVQTYNIDFVVMGTKGATKAKELLFGSNTVKIIKSLKHCPVIAIPNEYEFEEPKQIAFSTGLVRLYNDAQLQPLKEIAGLYHSKIRVITVFQEDKEFDEIQLQHKLALTEQLKSFEYSYHKIEDYTTKTKAIQHFIDEFEINMLVMVQYKHSIIEKIINEPTIKKIGYNPTIPFMIIPE